MIVSVIGTGSVGAALGQGFSAAGHAVVYGSRRHESAAVGELVAAAGEEASAAPPREAAAAGDVVVLAVPGGVVTDLASSLASELAGTPVVDPTNTVERPTSGRSIAEQVAEAAPDARVVKAFNTIGANRMLAPDFEAGTASMLVCGDDTNAKASVSSLAADLGFDPVDAGDLTVAIMLEDLARLWIHLARLHGRDIGFALLQD